MLIHDSSFRAWCSWFRVNGPFSSVWFPPEPGPVEFLARLHLRGKIKAWTNLFLLWFLLRLSSFWRASSLLPVSSPLHLQVDIVPHHPSSDHPLVPRFEKNLKLWRTGFAYCRRKILRLLLFVFFNFLLTSWFLCSTQFLDKVVSLPRVGTCSLGFPSLLRPRDDEDMKRSSWKSP